MFAVDAFVVGTGATEAAFVLGCGDGAATSGLTVGAAAGAAGLLLDVLTGVFILAGTTFAAAGVALGSEAVWSFFAVASSR
jgi:hypothetical protein